MITCLQSKWLLFLHRSHCSSSPLAHSICVLLIRSLSFLALDWSASSSPIKVERKAHLSLGNARCFCLATLYKLSSFYFYKNVPFKVDTSHHTFTDSSRSITRQRVPLVSGNRVTDVRLLIR